jgi:hypothetical protein
MQPDTDYMIRVLLELLENPSLTGFTGAAMAALARHPLGFLVSRVGVPHHPPEPGRW